MFVIIKNVKMKDSSTKLPVIILNTQSEIWEFDTYEEAEEIRTLFTKNSDSGHTYVVKEIG